MDDKVLPRATAAPYAPGTHVLLDLWGAVRLDDPAFIENAMLRAAEICGATVLETRLHHFPGGGVTGVALLAESHISIHTWPETGYAALDIFMCGNADAEAAVSPLTAAFRPASSRVTKVARGEAAAPASGGHVQSGDS